MIPVIRRIAYAELALLVVVVLGTAVSTVWSGSSVVNDLFNPHGGYALGLVTFAVVTVGASLVLIVSIPSALAKVLAQSPELTRGQVAVVVVGVLLVVSAAIALVISLLI